MYNAELNNQWTDKLINYCSNKSVLIVGNSISLFGDSYGKLIDSYDVVVRLGKGYPEKEFEEFIGKKTDCWIFSPLRTGMYKKFSECPFKVFNMTQFFFYDPNHQFLNIHKRLFYEQFQIYKDYFMLGNYRQVKYIIKKTNTGNRASQGITTISYFINIIKSYKKLDIIGFDFFESKVNYELNNHKHTVNSFHLPLPVVNTRNPHFDDKIDKINKEKEYVMSLKKENKIVVHEMDKYPSENTLNMLFKNFRNQAKH